jgi:succinate dehydrogenase / fumarate reductase cytochrome b subunit
VRLQGRIGRTARFWDSTVGKKMVMAVSGLIMAGFLITHVSANLLAFLGPDHINGYSRFLHATPEILWPARLVLLVSVVAHTTAAVQLTRLSRSARPLPYTVVEPQVATFAARTIRWFAVLLAVFIVVHLLHFTTGTLLPGFVEGDPYTNLVLAFTTQPAMTILYLGMMIVVALHLYHGAWSAVRTLGLSRPRADPFSRPVATLLAVLFWLGFSAVPLGIIAGVIAGEYRGGAVAAQR